MMMRNLFFFFSSTFTVFFSSHHFTHTHTLCFISCFILTGVVYDVFGPPVMISKMSVFYMGFSLGDDHEMKEGMVVQLKDENISNGMIENVGVNGFDFETEFEFWPIQHPTEPSHEDRPVQCPISHSSLLLNDQRMQDDRFSERKKPETSMVVHKENNVLEATEPAIRTVRKRHHDHTNTIMPLLQTLPVSSHQNMKTAVLNKLQQVQRFES